MFDSIRRAKREKENSGKILQQERHGKDKNGTLFLWAARSRIFLPSAAPQQWPTAAMMNLSSAPEQASPERAFGTPGRMRLDWAAPMR